MFDRDVNWESVGQSRSYRKITEWELVLTAMGIESRVERWERRWILLTREETVHIAEHQLALYSKENRVFTRTRSPSPVIENGFAGCMVFVVVLWIVHLLQMVGLDGGLRENGAMWAYAVRENNEWWRCFTALLLHADYVHLIGNTLMGVVFGWLASRHYGSGLCWFLVVCCGAAGNYLNALMQSPTFVSIGASTATFAIVGLLAGLFFRRGFIPGRGWKGNALPIAGAIGLFIMFGIGGENTDVMAHITGLLCGTVVGMIVGSIDIRVMGKSGQWITGATALGLLGWAILAS